MSELPKTWEWATLRQLTTSTRPICYGVLKPGEYVAGGVALLRIQDLTGNAISMDEVHCISASLDEEFRRSRLEGGEVLLSIQGTIGRTALVPRRLRGANISRTLAVIAPDESLDRRFLYYYFQHLAFEDAYETGGSTRASLNIGTIRSMTVPVPPLAEQCRIVAAMDEQFSHIHRAETMIQFLRPKLRSLIKALMSSLVKPDWPRRPLAELTRNFDGRRVPLKRDQRAIRSGPFLYYGASGPIDAVDGFLFDGDFLLIAEDGANLATRSKPIAFIATGQFWVNNHAHVVQAVDGVDLKYLELVLNQTNIQHSISGTAQPKLTQANLNRLAVPAPSLTEQQLLVAEHERSASLVAALSDVLAATERHATRLRRSILAAAFGGRLVSQDPNDEPATVSLSRIRSDRLVQATKKRQQKVTAS
jgi:type I restriction enzyme S subunit